MFRTLIKGILTRRALGKSDRKNHGGALQKGEAKFRNYIENSPEGVIVVNNEGKLLEANNAICQISGYSMKELLKMHIPETIAPESQDDAGKHFGRVVTEGHASGEFVFQRKDGSKGYWQVDAVKLSEDRFLGFIIDTTARREAEENLKNYSTELEQANILKNLFIDVIRHDILNPAGIIEGMTQMALEDVKDPEVGKQLQIIARTINRIIDLIENAAKLAELESEEMLEYEEKDLRVILKELIEEPAVINEYLAKEKKMHIKIPQAGDFLSSVNPLIYDAFLNLINNAIKYGPENSEVVVDIVDNGLRWRISVADEGETLNEKDRKEIFERFKRIDKGPIKGSGIGLAIVKKVVEAHKGEVWVEEKLGGGNIFCIEIPKSLP